MENEFFLYDDDEDYDSAEMDVYSEESLWDDGDGDVYEMPPEMTFAELVGACVHPTLRDTFAMLGKLLLYCVLYRFTTSLAALPKTAVHLASATTGLLALYTFAHEKMAYVLLLCLTGYVVLSVVYLCASKYYGVASAVVVVLFLLTCELFVVETEDWHVIRGIQMILSLKIISLGFDLDAKSVHFPSFLEAFGYYLCVGTLIFGPWTSFNDYSKLAACKAPLCRRRVLKLASSLTLAVVCLLLSTCFCHWLIPEHSNKWLLAYRDATSFRSSHYFVSFVSEVTAVCVGLGESGAGWDVKVSQPAHIEVPRSLTEVVIYWNMPMHYWLKTYVFKNFQPLHPFAAIFFTYAASALLHGLNFQLAAVLLSLGFYTFIEYNFRKKLSSVFSACISARRCNTLCTHAYKSNHPGVITANIAFGALAVFHLAYLGVMFDSSTSQQDQGYSMEHTLSKWSELNFASHWVTAAMYVVHWLI